MKKVLLFFAVIVTMMLSSCGFTNNAISNENQNQTSVVLSQANYEVVATAVGESSQTYVLGIGGLSKKALTTNAISELYKNANLTGNQQIINITTTTSIENWVVYSKHRAIARGYIIEFDK